MIEPSGMRLPKGETYQRRETQKGIYEVVNAYQGEYDFFAKRRPEAEIEGVFNGKAAPETATISTATDNCSVS